MPRVKSCKLKIRSSYGDPEAQRADDETARGDREARRPGTAEGRSTRLKQIMNGGMLPAY
jgi:hypothetical protein